MLERTSVSLEAENRRLRKIIATLRRENDALIMQVGAMAGGDVAKLRAELDAANSRANALRTALCQAWREHGVEPPAPDMPAAGAVTAEAAMQRLCWN